jgi:hypothetical protein
MNTFFETKSPLGPKGGWDSLWKKRLRAMELCNYGEIDFTRAALGGKRTSIEKRRRTTVGKIWTSPFAFSPLGD